eukprot:scaffold230882_cov27-Tisochrysis_lutea.AAC.2
MRYRARKQLRALRPNTLATTLARTRTARNTASPEQYSFTWMQPLRSCRQDRARPHHHHQPLAARQAGTTPPSSSSWQGCPARAG